MCSFLFLSLSLSHLSSKQRIINSGARFKGTLHCFLVSCANIELSLWNLALDNKLLCRRHSMGGREVGDSV